MVKSRVISTILCLVISIARLAAQDSLLYTSLSMQDTLCTIETAFNLIEDETGLSFSYNTGLINKKNIILLKSAPEQLNDLLHRILKDPLLEFSIIGKHLVIYQPVKVRAVNPESTRDSVLYFEIRGRVLDKADRKPLPFSSIYLFGKTIGIISNEMGEFILKLNTTYLSDTVIISCVGYDRFKSAVSALVNTTKDYYLSANTISIQEVIIRKASPSYLLQAATKMIGDNYQKKPALLTSFYRETVQKGNRFMMVSEAILETYKSGYSSVFGTDQIKIIRSRKSEDIGRDDTLVLKLKAGLNTTLVLDVVKDLPDFATGKYLDYNYRLADIVVDNGTDNYAVEFEPAKGTTGYIYSGRIIIGIRDMAFKWIEFYVDPEHLDQASDLFVIRKPPYVNVKVLKANYRIGYRKSGDKYYLHLIQCETSYRVRNRNQLSGTVYNSKIEMVVTDIDTTQHERFPNNETAHLNEFFSDQVSSYDPEFWGEYNYVAPEESLENAIVKLKKSQAKKEEELAE